MTDLSVIIVLFNEFSMVQRCIASVYIDRIPSIEIILIDNSTDKEEYIKILKKFPKIRYIQNKTNIGFGKAVNIGLLHAKGKYSTVLTPDTKVLPGTFKKTLNFIKKHPKIALLGCKIFSYPREFHPSAFHTFPNLFSHFYEYNMIFYKLVKRIFPNYHPLFYSKEDHEKELHVQHIIGGYMLLRTAIVKKLGYFDNQFHMYREETDLCKRLITNHWEIVYLPIAGLIHYGGSAWKKTTISQALPQYQESTYLFFKKHYGRSYAIAAWSIGLFSAVMSIPFLAFTSIYKFSTHQQSQSTILLPLWIRILSWHITQGLQII